MDRNSSISNFKWPKAFLLSLSAFALANLAVAALVKGGILHPERTSNNLQQMERALRESGHLVVIGNSTATRVDLEILGREAPLFSGKKGLSLAVQGGTPRTHRFLLERSGYRCIDRGGFALFFISPMDLNRNNQAFRWTVRDFFSWRDWLDELFLRGRFLEATYFLQRAILPLAKYHYAIRDFLLDGARLGSIAHAVGGEVSDGTGQGVERAALDRNRVDERLVRDSVMAYRDRYLTDFDLDDYQMDSVSKILEGLRRREVRAVIILPPLADVLRALMKHEDLEAYTAAVRSLAGRHGAGFLDYVSSYSGTEYLFYDGSHLTDHSAGLFSRRLARDIMAII